MCAAWPPCWPQWLRTSAFRRPTPSLPLCSPTVRAASAASRLAALTLRRRPLFARVAAFRRHRLPVAAALLQAGQEAADGAGAHRGRRARARRGRFRANAARSHLPAAPVAQEIDTLCAEWHPEPLVPALTEAQRTSAPPVLVGYVREALCPLERLHSPPDARRPTGARVKLAGGTTATNFVSFDFLGLAGDSDVQARARPRKPSAVSCGALTAAPRAAGGVRRSHPEVRRRLLRAAWFLRNDRYCPHALPRFFTNASYADVSHRCRRAPGA